MKYLRILLENYIGIYNGLGLNKIEIDFTQCKYKTLIIRGPNASGKSTISNALSPLPDSNNNFIPNLPAKKELDILDEGIIYRLRFIHGIDNNGNRTTSKSYISKQIGLEEIELNPNGNLGTYKDTIYEEFKLDSNFVSLSQLSCEDRGLVDKTPAERKKFLVKIIEKLSVYNDIHKTLTKRSSIFKSMMNSLVVKIDSIGEEESLKTSLSAIENSLSNLSRSRDQLIEQRSIHKSKIQLLDPDSKLQLLGTDILNSLVQLKREEEYINDQIKSSCEKFNLKELSFDDLLKSYKDISEKLNKIQSDVLLKENDINYLLLEKEKESANIMIKSQKLNSLLNNTNFNDLKNRIDYSKLKLEEYERIINEIGIEINTISKDEFILGLETLKDIKEMILVFKSNIYHSHLEEAINYINTNTYPNINKLKNELQIKSDLLDSLNNKYQYYSSLLEITSKLALRPKKCKIDNCKFISDALEALDKEPAEKLASLTLDIDKTIKEIEYLEKTIKENEEVISTINQLNVLIRTIQKNSIILNKLPIDSSFSQKNILMNRIKNNDPFIEIDTLYEYIEESNVIDEYKAELSIYNNLMQDYNLYESKASIIDEINSDIKKLNEKVNELYQNIESSQSKLLEKKREMQNYKLSLSNYDILIDLYRNKDKLLEDKKEIINRYNTVKINLKTIQDNINSINVLDKQINEIEVQINPLSKEKDALNHSLILLKEYREELRLYTAKFKKIEVIKKYSSPNKGIQTLYMELYMNKTLSMGNELLSLIFDGKYALQQYVINENEFRIPCMGSGIMNDDISSMSSGQKAMISTILSFVLLQQSSTRYNIPKLDEIDATLDNENRLNFVKVSNILMDIMNVEQCFIISHNEEINLANCDILDLVHNYSSKSEGNEIFIS